MLVEVFDDLFPVGEDDVAHARPLTQAFIARVVLRATHRVAQDGVRGEEDGGVLGTCDRGESLGDLQVACDGGHGLVAGALRQLRGHADEVVVIARRDGDAVRGPRVESFPVGVIQQVMALA